MTRGDLILLPGGLLGRVVVVVPGGVYVDRWSTSEPSGWRYFGLETRALPGGDVAAHHNYSAAWSRRGEPAT